MRVCVLAGLLGCYAPHVPAGVACDPAAPICPDGETCRAETGRFVCGGLLALDAATPTDATDLDAPDTGMVGPDAIAHVEYPATVAECVEPSRPSTAECRTANGNLQLAVDTRDTGTGKPWHGFIRFDVDGAVAGRTVTSVKLRVVATSDGKAPGPDSGELYPVTSFDVLSLNVAVPARTTTTPIAPSRGAVSMLTPIEWPLPVAAIAANTGVFVEINPLNDDGVNYWNIDGPDPPVLLVDLQ